MLLGRISLTGEEGVVGGGGGGGDESVVSRGREEDSVSKPPR